MRGAMAGRGGRPWGPIRAESAEAQALAEFLRRQVDASGLTMTVVAERIHVSRTQAGLYLAGRIPHQDFVTALVRATVPEPRRRERCLAEAVRLLHAALHPAPDSSAPPHNPAAELARLRAQQVETYDRLTRSLEQQAELVQAANNSAHLVMVLLNMLQTLERRVGSLSAERDRLRERTAEPGELEQAQRQLARALDQEQRAQEELARAEQKQRRAEELAERVQAQVRMLTEELDRLRAGGAPGRERPAGAGEQEQPVPAPAGDTVGDDIDQALARAVAVNDADDLTLRRISDQLQDEDEDDPGVPGAGAADPPGAPGLRPVVPDNPDNPSAGFTSGEAARHTLGVPDRGHRGTDLDTVRRLIALHRGLPRTVADDDGPTATDGALTAPRPVGTADLVAPGRPRPARGTGGTARPITRATVISMYSGTSEGGGKTTSAVNLAATLARQGHRTLLVDLAGGDASVALGIDPGELDLTLYELMMLRSTEAEDVVLTVHDELALLPSNSGIRSANTQLVADVERQSVLAQALQPLLFDHDYVVIDCPPGLEMLTINALTASDTVVSPVRCDFTGLHSLLLLADTFERMRSGFNPRLRFEGVLVTRYLGGAHESDVLDAFAHLFGDCLLHTVIPYTPQIPRSTVAGQPLHDFAPRSAARQAYEELAVELRRSLTSADRPFPDVRAAIAQARDRLPRPDAAP
ncbi:AAA family ATPase [Kitasatospora sp. NPDC004289]